MLLDNIDACFGHLSLLSGDDDNVNLQSTIDNMTPVRGDSPFDVSSVEQHKDDNDEKKSTKSDQPPTKPQPPVTRILTLFLRFYVIFHSVRFTLCTVY